MYRKYLDRRPKRRNESSSARRSSSLRIGDRDTIELSPHRHTSSMKGASIKTIVSTNLPNPSHNSNNNEPLSVPYRNSSDMNTHDEENCVPLPDANLSSQIIAHGDNRQLTSFPTNIQINTSSSSISSVTTSGFITDENSDKSLNTNQSSLTLSSKEKTRRLSLFTRDNDSSNKVAYNRKLRLIRNLKRTLKALGNDEQGGIILEETLNDPEFENLRKKARLIHSEEHTFYSNVTRNLFNCVKQVSDKTNSRGRLNDKERIARDLLVTGVVPSPSNPSSQSTQTLQDTKKFLIRHSKVPETTARRILELGKSRKAILSNPAEHNTTWCVLRERSHYKTMQRTLRDDLINWVLSHEHVIPSPQTSDTILVLNPKTQKREPVTKLLLQISVRELHDDLIGPPPKGLPSVYDPISNQLLVSESTLRAMLPPQLRRMTNAQKDICGCECCISTKLLHQALLQFRSNNKALRSMTNIDTFLNGALSMKEDNSKMSPSRPNDVVKLITCLKESCTKYDWNCILDRCTICNPSKNTWFGQRSFLSALNVGNQDIHFGIYTMHTRCKLHGALKPGAKVCMECENDHNVKSGVIISKRELTKTQKPLNVFLSDYYFPQIFKYRYHMAIVELLGKHETKLQRKTVFQNHKSWFLTERDYAERMKKEIDNEIQSEHFGHHVSLSIEGCTMEHHVECAKTHTYAVHMDFHSHMSDESNQDATTTHVHMCTMLDHYLSRFQSFPDDCCILDHTDGCAKQYRCGNALFLLSALCQKYKIVIDRAIAAPGHGKSIIDGLNAVDKTHLRRRMMMSNPLADKTSEKCVNVYNYTNNTANSFANECARICAQKARSSGVLNSSNYSARSKTAKLTNRYYHVHNDKNSIPSIHPKTTQGWLSYGHGKIGIRHHYNFRADPKLPLGQVAARRIPCACEACINQLKEPWIPNEVFQNQPRYKGGNKQCVYWPIFHGLNDWLLIDIVDKQSIDDVNENSIVENALVCNTMHVANEIAVDGYGALATNDNNVKVGYYIIKWTSTPYPLQCDTNIDTFNPPLVLKAGEMVCDAVYLNAVPNCKLVYTHSDAESLATKVLLQHIVDANIEMKKLSSKDDLPKNMRKLYRNIKKLDAVMVSAHTHECIVEEIQRRNMLDLEY